MPVRIPPQVENTNNECFLTKTWRLILKSMQVTRVIKNAKMYRQTLPDWSEARFLAYRYL